MDKIIGQFRLSYQGKNGYCEYESHFYSAYNIGKNQFVVFGVTPIYRRRLYMVGYMNKDELAKFV